MGTIAAKEAIMSVGREPTRGGVERYCLSKWMLLSGQQSSSRPSPATPRVRQSVHPCFGWCFDRVNGRHDKKEGRHLYFSTRWHHIYRTTHTLFFAVSRSLTPEQASHCSCVYDMCCRTPCGQKTMLWCSACALEEALLLLFRYSFRQCQGNSPV